uniref:Uncharacterized protein n=1 Tax=Percolomonas cosmopolitus TaxID=63605 RepID=A0A7S1PFD6_9EUKA
MSRVSIFALLTFLLVLIQTSISSPTAVCSDINALHELKISSSFKNTIQSYSFLPKNKIYFVTQEVTFSDWSQSSDFILGHFTEANGGQDQFKQLFSGEENIIKDFVVFDKDSSELFCSASVHNSAESNYTLSLLTYGKRVPIPYPIPVENVYDVNGTVIQKRTISRVILEDFSYEASRKQIQLANITPNTTTLSDDTNIDGVIAMLYFSEGSLKLMRGVMRGEGADKKLHPSLTYDWTHLVVPKVVGYSIDASTYDSILHVHHETNELLVVVTLDRMQQAAFEDVHPGIALKFNNMMRAPFVLRFSMDGTLLSATNVIQNTFNDEVSLHVSGIDVRDNKLLVVGNQFPSDGLHFDHIAGGAYYSVVDLSPGGGAKKFTRSHNFLLSGDDARYGFIMRDATFAPDSESTNIFFFAGDVQKDTKNLYDVEGRVFLSDGTSALRQIIVGESGSNIVRKMSRYLDSDTGGESVVLDMHMDAPLSPPEHPDDPQKEPFRKVNAGFWLMDCSSPDHTMETAAYISFFTILSISLMVFIGAVSAFSVLCVFQEREKRAKRQANLQGERAQLVVNRR